MTAKTLTITMSERRPVTLVADEWPVVARADWHSGEHESQANETARIVVREHEDGRRIVYSVRERGNGGMPSGYRDTAGGYMVGTIAGDMRQPSSGGPLTSAHPDEAETIRAIRRAGGVVGMDRLADECIADLPAESI